MRAIRITILLKYASLFVGVLLVTAASVWWLATQPSVSGTTQSLLFVGDTAFGESYQEVLERQGKENILKTKGYAYLLENFREILGDSKMVVANLETPITDVSESPFEGQKNYLHHGDIVQTPQMLNALGIDLVSLGNNHTLDYGIEGLTQTTTILADHSLPVCGAGQNQAEAERAYEGEIQVSNGTFQYAIICAFEYRQSYAERYQYYAGENTPGVNALSLSRIEAQIRAIKNTDPDRFVIIYPHWSDNYMPASGEQKELGRQLIDAGADLVIGHGAHVAQEVERYNNKWILYNIGNFIFASPGRYAEIPTLPYSLIAQLVLSDRGAPEALALYPIVTDNLTTNYQSRFVSKDEFTQTRTLLAPSNPDRFNGRQGQNKYGQYWLFDI